MAGTNTRRVGPFRVYTRASWGDAWTLRDRLYVESIEVAAAPKECRATLRYHYGERWEYGAAAAIDTAPVDYSGHYVKIVYVDDPDGAATEKIKLVGIAENIIQNAWQLDTANDEAGDETITVYGLERLLDMIEITGAFTKPVDQAGAAVVAIDWCPTFNKARAHGGQIVGNRSSSKTNDVYAFADVGNAVSAAERWTHKDILEYLMAHYKPAGVAWAVRSYGAGGLVDDAIVESLDGIETVQRLEGVTLRDALSRLIYRPFGYGWVVTYDAGSDEAVIRVFTHVDFDIAVEGVTIPANADVVTRDLDEHGTNAGLEIDRQTIPRYDKIIVEGERAIVCCSLSVADATLTGGWTAAAETAYLNGAGAADGKENDVARQQDALKPVFARFRPPTSWNGKAGDGEGGIAANNMSIVFVTLNDTGGLTAGEVKKGGVSGRTFLRHLPLLKGYDYTASPPSSSWAASEAPEYLEPIAFVYDDVESVWVHAEKGMPAETGERVCQARIRPDDAGLAIWVDYNPNHVLARNHWAAAEASLYDPDVEWGVDYETMIVTVAIEVDARLRVVSELPAPLRHESARVKRVCVPGAEYHRVVKGTVLDVDSAGALVKASADATIRDDGERLRVIAKIAEYWHFRERNAVKMRSSDMDDHLNVGQVLDGDVTSTLVDTWGVVTAVRWAVFEGVVETRTEFADIDVLALAARVTGTPDIASHKNLIGEVSEHARQIVALQERAGNMPVREVPARPFSPRYIEIIDDGSTDVATLWENDDTKNDQGVFDLYDATGASDERRVMIKANRQLGNDLSFERLIIDMVHTSSALTGTNGINATGGAGTQTVALNQPLNLEIRAITAPARDDIDMSAVTWKWAYTDGNLVFDGNVVSVQIATVKGNLKCTVTDICPYMYTIAFDNKSGGNFAAGDRIAEVTPIWHAYVWSATNDNGTGTLRVCSTDIIGTGEWFKNGDGAGGVQARVNGAPTANHASGTGVFDPSEDVPELLVVKADEIPAAWQLIDIQGFELRLDLDADHDTARWQGAPAGAKSMAFVIRA